MCWLDDYVLIRPNAHGVVEVVALPSPLGWEVEGAISDAS